MKESRKRVVLITGGSSGIGFEMARLMLEEDSKVIICGRSQEKLNDAKSKLPELNVFQCDISSGEERSALAERLNRDFPDINMLMNNAGIVKRFLMETTGDITECIKAEWETNYFAPVILAQLLMPALSRNSGTVVNISSGLAHLPLSIEPNYCATKAAMHSITQSMRIRYAKKGVNVVEILYPEVNTPFQEGHATKRAISPEMAAKEALKRLNRGQAEIHVGMSRMINLFSRIIPMRGVNMINGFITEKEEEILRER